SLMDVHNNNIWLVEAIARAATDNHWPRVDVKSGNTGLGVNGGFQGTVKSPMNKGRAYGIPGVGLAGDWPGGWTQTYAQVDTEAGMHGFDRDYFVQQVAGLTQLAGEFMLVKPVVIDLGWGTLKSALVKLSDAAFVEPHAAKLERQALVNQYVAAFRHTETGALGDARTALSSLSEKISGSVVSEQQSGLRALVEHQLERLA
ncbi:MAG TPA: hypothetical protein VH640_22305, partial [Bryobacteraceae bacterium]